MTDRSPTAGGPTAGGERAPRSGGADMPAAVARRRRVVAAAVAGAGVVGLVYLAGHDPHDPGVAMPRCPIRHLTGLDCPACGTLRATHSLLHARWATAARDNGFVLACAPLLGGLLARQARAVAAGRHAPVPPRVAYGLGAAALAWMALRNLPFWPA
ncbi:conserved hypothetical protein [Frankia canadensis]|uniref:DUF2752 domain-containing protein n=1 Tax=Frankia canadensis TaxID=1836972 RepID=A0A2I2KS62_9ACTN|nr:DUF2752 domain-containing protein [Frankia canadensis]SNQ48504.1 conserved hypothetical protein [Frankia canadensis]SOU55794.1 conserved hypothetical protein [Frankia canadensis]